jgi:tetratricopeptide (TPR) repeat protein
MFIMLTFYSCGENLTEYDNLILDGIASLNTNKPEKAVEDFTKAIQLSDQKAGGYLGRANALNTLGRYEDAITDYSRAIKIDPNLANAYVNRGIAHSHLGKIKLAIKDYEKGLELDPEIDDPPGFVKRLFDNVPNREKGIRNHLEHLKKQVKENGEIAPEKEATTGGAIDDQSIYRSV